MKENMDLFDKFVKIVGHTLDAEEWGPIEIGSSHVRPEYFKKKDEEMVTKSVPRLSIEIWDEDVEFHESMTIEEIFDIEIWDEDVEFHGSMTIEEIFDIEIWDEDVEFHESMTIEEIFDIEIWDEDVEFHGSMTIEEIFDLVNYFEKKGYNQITPGKEDSCLFMRKKESEIK
jgi:hypothetical protein